MRDSPETTRERGHGGTERTSDRPAATVDVLKILEEIAVATSSDQPIDDVVRCIVDQCVDRFSAEQGAIHLYAQDEAANQWQTLLRVATKDEMGKLRLDDQVAGWMVLHQRPLRIPDTADSEEPLASRLCEAGIVSFMAAPLRFRGSLIGAISLYNKHARSGFTAEHERTLTIVAAHSSQVIRAAQLLGDIRRDRDVLKEANRELQRELARRDSIEGIIGQSPQLTRVLAVLDQIKGASVDVLITGESGTGKELVARAIHTSSPRSGKPFVALNCAALPQELLEAELFGIEKGVATGVDQRLGQIETAQGGTLFLDEVGDLSLTGQAKLLRALQERTIQRVGGRISIPVDIRVIAATNKDLEKLVAEGQFREDLFYRINVIRIRIPPLRERKEDIPLLVRFFVDHFCREFQRPPVRIEPEAVARLAAELWPGNVRELQNRIKRLVICSGSGTITTADLAEDWTAATPRPADQTDAPKALEDAVAAFEKQFVVQALEKHDWNQAKAASSIGLSRAGLFKKLRRLGIDAKQLRSEGSE